MDTVTAPAIWDTSSQLSWQSNLVQKLISSSGSSLVTEEEIGNSHTIYCSKVIFLQTHGRFNPELILWNLLIAEFFLQSPFILTTFFWLIGRFNQDRNLSPGLRAPINLRRYHEHTSGAQCVHANYAFHLHISIFSRRCLHKGHGCPMYVMYSRYVWIDISRTSDS